MQHIVVIKTSQMAISRILYYTLYTYTKSNEFLLLSRSLRTNFLRMNSVERLFIVMNAYSTCIHVCCFNWKIYWARNEQILIKYPTFSSASLTLVNGWYRFLRILKQYISIVTLSMYKARHLVASCISIKGQ